MHHAVLHKRWFRFSRKTVMANAPDRRRYTGPETSWPVPFAKARELSELIDEASGLRADGRKPDEARPICELIDGGRRWNEY